MYELMVTVSVVVHDIAPAVETLTGALGIPEPRPQSYRDGPGIRAVFCRVHPKYAVAPTFLELVAPGPIPADAGEHVFPVAAVAAVQGDRAVKVHATELGMPDETLVDLGEHLERLGVPHRVVPGAPLPRLFVGTSSPSSFDPSADAGLFVEACPSSELQLAEEAFTAPADIPPDARPETMVRIVAREHLVEDLDATLRVLERNLRWTPSSVRGEDGCRRAVMPFSVPRSATLELVEPRGPGGAADDLAAHGPGPWTIRIAVVDLAAKADDLAARGTPCSLDAGVLRPDPKATLGVPFELVAAPRPG
jgi:hypothetical protein